MRRSVTLFALLAVFSMLAFAESWQGRLIDANCSAPQKTAAACDPANSTTMFALVVANKEYKLDQVGNAKAADALRSRADRSSDPTKPASTQVMAKITGTKDGDNTWKVEKVEIQ